MNNKQLKERKEEIAFFERMKAFIGKFKTGVSDSDSLKSFEAYCDGYNSSNIKAIAIYEEELS